MTTGTHVEDKEEGAVTRWLMRNCGWMTVLVLLVPFFAAMAWAAWGKPL